MRLVYGVLPSGIDAVFFSGYILRKSRGAPIPQRKPHASSAGPASRNRFAALKDRLKQPDQG